MITRKALARIVLKCVLFLSSAIFCTFVVFSLNSSAKFATIGSIKLTKPKHDSDAQASSSGIVDVYRYKWTIVEKNFCISRPSLKFVIVVHSAVHHFENRQILRDMYSDEFLAQHDAAMLFSVAMSANNTVQDRVRRESSIFHDIIQQQFVDSYRNLTWKAVMWIRFVDEYCPKIRYIIKLDDDVVAHFYNVLELLQNHKHKKEHNQIICRVIWHRLVERNRKNKWYVTKEELPNKFYLTYCVGMAIILSRDIIPKLLAAAQNERYFWIDDYFFSGVLAAKVGARFEDLKRRVVVHSHEGSEIDLLKGSVLFRSQPDMQRGKSLWEEIQRRYDTAQNSTLAIKAVTKMLSEAAGRNATEE